MTAEGDSTLEQYQRNYESQGCLRLHSPWHHLPEISLRYSLTFSKLPGSAEEPSCHIWELFSPQTMRVWELYPTPNANLKALTQLWTPSWPARLLPHGGFLPFFVSYGGKEVLFTACCAPFPKQPSVPHVLASY